MIRPILRALARVITRWQVFWARLRLERLGPPFDEYAKLRVGHLNCIASFAVKGRKPAFMGSFNRTHSLKRIGLLERDGKYLRLTANGWTVARHVGRLIGSQDG